MTVMHVIVRMPVVMIMMMLVSMIVTTAAVFAMSVFMAMTMRVVVRVIMTVIVVVMCVRVRSFFRVGPAFRIEGSIDARDFRAEFHHELLEHMIAPDPNPIVENLCGHMAVAEMPGNAREMMRIFRGDFYNRLSGCNDTNDAAVLKFQSVAVVKHCRFCKVQQENGIAISSHGNAAAMPAVVWQFDCVGLAFAVPLACWQHFCGADHLLLATLFGPLIPQNRK